MPLEIKNSPNSTPAKPLVNINGDDYAVSDLNAVVQDALRVRASASFADSVLVYAPSATSTAGSTPAGAGTISVITNPAHPDYKASADPTADNEKAGLKTPA